MRYPIEQSHYGFWFVWSLPIEHTIGGEERAKDLPIFSNYKDGKVECSKRNLAFVINRGIADQNMTNSTITYRNYYEGEINA